MGEEGNTNNLKLREENDINFCKTKRHFRHATKKVGRAHILLTKVNGKDIVGL